MATQQCLIESGAVRFQTLDAGLAVESFSIENTLGSHVLTLKALDGGAVERGLAARGQGPRVDRGSRRRRFPRRTPTTGSRARG